MEDVLLIVLLLHMAMTWGCLGYGCYGWFKTVGPIFSSKHAGERHQYIQSQIPRFRWYLGWVAVGCVGLVIMHIALIPAVTGTGMRVGGLDLGFGA